MELSLGISASPCIDRSLFTSSHFVQSQYPLRRFTRNSSRELLCQPRSQELLLEKHFFNQSKMSNEDDESTSWSSLSEESSLLSLTEKPDRNFTVLDDYEMEELDIDADPNHRSGYVAVLGKPNVGKSTLSNQMIGQKLSIVTDKPQTTRHRILGICSGPEYQMILYDTPGVIEKKMHKPDSMLMKKVKSAAINMIIYDAPGVIEKKMHKPDSMMMKNVKSAAVNMILYDTPGVMEKKMHKLDSMMMKNVKSAATNADCVLVVVDACKLPQKIDEVLDEGMGSLTDKLPVLIVLNKKDLIKPGEIAKKLEWYQKFTDVDDIIPVSAKYGHGVEDVRSWIISKLPQGPAYYPKDIASEHPERFFVGEIVREKIFMQYRNEVPYACQVNVINYVSRPTAKDFIQVEIVVEKSSQKIILIGKEGRALKLLATAARLDIEDFLQKKVFLEIDVKVKENWREDEGLLKHYGYGGQIRAL